MKIKDIINESFYHQPEQIIKYGIEDITFDLLKDIPKTFIENVINLRNEILKISNNYSTTPRIAFGKTLRNEYIEEISILRKLSYSYSKNSQIIYVLDEIENYFLSI